MIDKITNNSLGQIDLKAVFSGKNNAQLLPYLPRNQFKTKLEAWLKHDVKRADEV